MMFKNRMLGKILWPKREKVIGDWRILHNDELLDLYLTKHRVIKSRKRWAGHVACMGGRRFYICILGFGDGIILKWIFKKQDRIM